jgi:adenine phosphoribosyltransferase
MMTIKEKIDLAIREIPDFPKPGILFKDITPILHDSSLCQEIVQVLADYWKGKGIDGIAGIESRGFLFGLPLAIALGVPFIPIRKAGKLPAKTIAHSYDLEYGSATLELHVDAISNGQRILIHDDLLATGGSVEAATALINAANGVVAGYSFLIELAFLNGRKSLHIRDSEIHSLSTCS